MLSVFIPMVLFLVIGSCGSSIILLAFVSGISVFSGISIVVFGLRASSIISNGVASIHALKWLGLALNEFRLVFNMLMSKVIFRTMVVVVIVRIVTVVTSLYRPVVTITVVRVS